MIADRSINAVHTGAVNFVYFCFCRVEAVFHFLEPLVWTCLMMNPRAQILVFLHSWLRLEDKHWGCLKN